MSRPPLQFRPPTESAAEADAPRPVAQNRPHLHAGSSPAAETRLDLDLQSDGDPLAAFDSEQSLPEPEPHGREVPEHEPLGHAVREHELRGREVREPDAREPEVHEPEPPARGQHDEPESEIRYKTQRRPPSTNPGILVVLLAIGILGGILALTYMAVRGPAEPPVEAAAPAAPVAPMGQAQFDSRPSGADVVIDGVMRGKTPIKLSLPVGDHSLEIRAEAGTRSIPLTIESGVLVSQYVELVGMPDPSTGRLEITSDPPGAQVRLDGVVRGATPLTLDAVDARSHSVALSRGGATVYRTVRVSPGATASVFASIAASASTGAAGGFVTLTAPFELQVFEGGRLIGTTSADRLTLPPGRHNLQLVSDALQIRTTLDVDIAAGRTATAVVPVPNGSLSVNALPWAEVFVDGRGVGTTPLANLTIPVGNHEVTWRHPELGERRQPVTVTAQTPVRVGVNFAQ